MHGSMNIKVAGCSPRFSAASLHDPYSDLIGHNVTSAVSTKTFMQLMISHFFIFEINVHSMLNTCIYRQLPPT